MFSNESFNTLIKEDPVKGKTLHFHKIGDDKLGILQEILKEYEFPNEYIENIVEADIYQFSIENKTGSTRIITEKIGNKYSVLFIDSNHHIYFNDYFANKDKNLFYEYCPKYNSKICVSMITSGDCYAFEYLDIEKLEKSYNYLKK